MPYQALVMAIEASKGLMPTVSVVIPVRNGKPFLDQAVESVISQSFEDLELIIVDDGSDDDNYDRFLLMDPRIRVIHLAGSGVSVARNTGMQCAKGHYIAFLDADDVWFPGKLSSQIRYLERHPEVWVVFGGFKNWVVMDNGEFGDVNALTSDCSSLSTASPNRSGWLYTRLLNGLLVGMNTAVIRREVYESVGGFNESMRQGEDYDFWLRASRLAEMHSLNGEVALYRIHGSSAMHKLSGRNHLRDLLVAAKLRWGLKNPDGTGMRGAEFSRRLAQVAFDHGYTHFWRGDRHVALLAFWDCLKGGYRPVRSLVYILRCLIS